MQLLREIWAACRSVFWNPLAFLAIGLMVGIFAGYCGALQDLDMLQRRAERAERAEQNKECVTVYLQRLN